MFNRHLVLQAMGKIQSNPETPEVEDIIEEH